MQHIDAYFKGKRMPFILQIIIGTPYWVWVLLVYLILVGIGALKDRKISLVRLAILPVVFVVWSLLSFMNKTSFALVVYPFAWIIGAFFGFQFMQRLRIGVDRNTSMISVPGSIVPLMVSCGFFIVKYCLGVGYAFDPLLKVNMFVAGFDAWLSGIFSGFSFGRFLKILHKYREKLS